MAEHVGFVGLGRMGSEMARHLAESGFEVHGVDPVAAARERAVASGIDCSENVASLASMPVVLSSLPDSPQVVDVYEELIPQLEPGALCIDLSTMSVTTSRTLGELASQHDVAFLDAPVSGTSTHAAAGTLAIMVGGPTEAAERARRYLEPFSNLVHHCGPNGAGLEMKLITNRLLTTHLVAIGEAIIEMEAAGLDVAASIDLLKAGAVPRLLDYKAMPMANRDYSPFFTVDLMSKDLGLADERRIAGRVTSQAAEVMREAQAAGHGPKDIAAIMTTLQQ